MPRFPVHIKVLSRSRINLYPTCSQLSMRKAAVMSNLDKSPALAPEFLKRKVSHPAPGKRHLLESHTSYLHTIGRNLVLVGISVWLPCWCQLSGRTVHRTIPQQEFPTPSFFPLKKKVVAHQFISSLIGVQPEKKLVLLLSILFFFFTNGSWFSWDSSSLTSREAAVLGFFMSTSWSVISFKTYQESKEDNCGVCHSPEEASLLALEFGGST